MLEMDLALHAATPKIEAFYQYYQDKALKQLKNLEQDPKKCGSWVEWYGSVICDVYTLAQLAGVGKIESESANADTAGTNFTQSFPRPHLLPFDHIHPPPQSSLARPPLTAVLYGSLHSANFKQLHDYLYSLSLNKDTSVEYVLRWVPETSSDREIEGTEGGNGVVRKNYLSGYSVALDLKKTDYLAVDDRHTKHSAYFLSFILFD
jgi:UDP-glucose:glycoprotein glucosyltransferase